MELDSGGGAAASPTDAGATREPIARWQTPGPRRVCRTNCRRWRKLQPRLLSRQIQDNKFAFCREPTGLFRRSVGSTDNDDALPRLCATASTRRESPVRRPDLACFAGIAVPDCASARTRGLRCEEAFGARLARRLDSARCGRADWEPPTRTGESAMAFGLLWLLRRDRRPAPVSSLKAFRLSELRPVPAGGDARGKSRPVSQRARMSRAGEGRRRSGLRGRCRRG